MATTATLAALSGCATPLSTLDPAGPAATGIADLWWIMLTASGVLFLLVCALLVLSYARPDWITRWGSTRFVLGLGFAMPLTILIVLVLAALLLGERFLPGRGNATQVQATASQWTWSFQYPQTPGVTSERVLHIPAGEPVDITVVSTDVIHAFWVPRLGGKIDAIPGHDNRIRLQADRPGTYRGICAEYCGTGHADMGFVVEAHAPQDYAAALEDLR